MDKNVEERKSSEDNSEKKKNDKDNKSGSEFVFQPFTISNTQKKKIQKTKDPGFKIGSNLEKNPIGYLQEMFAKVGSSPHYEFKIVKEESCHVHVTTVTIGDLVVSSKGLTKKESKNNAAKAAVDRINRKKLDRIEKEINRKKLAIESTKKEKEEKRPNVSSGSQTLSSSPQASDKEPLIKKRRKTKSRTRSGSNAISSSFSLSPSPDHKRRRSSSVSSTRSMTLSPVSSSSNSKSPSLSPTPPSKAKNLPSRSSSKDRKETKSKTRACSKNKSAPKKANTLSDKIKKLLEEKGKEASKTTSTSPTSSENSKKDLSSRSPSPKRHREEKSRKDEKQCSTQSKKSRTSNSSERTGKRHSEKTSVQIKSFSPKSSSRPKSQPLSPEGSPRHRTSISPKISFQSRTSISPKVSFQYKKSQFTVSPRRSSRSPRALTRYRSRSPKVLSQLRLHTPEAPSRRISWSPEASSRHRSPVASSRQRSPVASSRHRSPVVSSRRISPVASSRHRSPVASSRHGSPVASSRHRSPVASYRRRSSEYCRQSPESSSKQRSLEASSRRRTPEALTRHKSRSPRQKGVQTQKTKTYPLLIDYRNKSTSKHYDLSISENDFMPDGMSSPESSFSPGRIPDSPEKPPKRRLSTENVEVKRRRNSFSPCKNPSPPPDYASQTVLPSPVPLFRINNPSYPTAEDSSKTLYPPRRGSDPHFVESRTVKISVSPERSVYTRRPRSSSFSPDRRPISPEVKNALKRERSPLDLKRSNNLPNRFYKNPSPSGPAELIPKTHISSPILQKDHYSINSPIGDQIAEKVKEEIQKLNDDSSRRNSISECTETTKSYSISKCNDSSKSYSISECTDSYKTTKVPTNSVRLERNSPAIDCRLDFKRTKQSTVSRTGTLNDEKLRQPLLKQRSREPSVEEILLESPQSPTPSSSSVNQRVQKHSRGEMKEKRLPIKSSPPKKEIQVVTLDDDDSLSDNDIIQPLAPINPRSSEIPSNNLSAFGLPIDASEAVVWMTISDRAHGISRPSKVEVQQTSSHSATAFMEFSSVRDAIRFKASFGGKFLSLIPNLVYVGVPDTSLIDLSVPPEVEFVDILGQLQSQNQSNRSSFNVAPLDNVGNLSSAVHSENPVSVPCRPLIEDAISFTSSSPRDGSAISSPGPPPEFLSKRRLPDLGKNSGQDLLDRGAVFDENKRIVLVYVDIKVDPTNKSEILELESYIPSVSKIISYTQNSGSKYISAFFHWVRKHVPNLDACNLVFVSTCICSYETFLKVADNNDSKGYNLQKRFKEMFALRTDLEYIARQKSGGSFLKSIRHDIDRLGKLCLKYKVDTSDKKTGIMMENVAKALLASPGETSFDPKEILPYCEEYELPRKDYLTVVLHVEVIELRKHGREETLAAIGTIGFDVVNKNGASENKAKDEPFWFLPVIPTRKEGVVITKIAKILGFEEKDNSSGGSWVYTKGGQQIACEPEGDVFRKLVAKLEELKAENASDGVLVITPIEDISLGLLIAAISHHKLNEKFQEIVKGFGDVDRLAKDHGLDIKPHVYGKSKKSPKSIPAYVIKLMQGMLKGPPTYENFFKKYIYGIRSAKTNKLLWNSGSHTSYCKILQEGHTEDVYSIEMSENKTIKPYNRNIKNSEFITVKILDVPKEEVSAHFDVECFGKVQPVGKERLRIMPGTMELQVSVVNVSNAETTLKKGEIIGTATKSNTYVVDPMETGDNYFLNGSKMTIPVLSSSEQEQTLEVGQKIRMIRCKPQIKSNQITDPTPMLTLKERSHKINPNLEIPTILASASPASAINAASNLPSIAPTSKTPSTVSVPSVISICPAKDPSKSKGKCFRNEDSAVSKKVDSMIKAHRSVDYFPSLGKESMQDADTIDCIKVTSPPGDGAMKKAEGKERTPLNLENCKGLNKGSESCKLSKSSNLAEVNEDDDIVEILDQVENTSNRKKRQVIHHDSSTKNLNKLKQKLDQNKSIVYEREADTLANSRKRSKEMAEKEPRLVNEISIDIDDEPESGLSDEVLIVSNNPKLNDIVREDAVPTHDVNDIVEVINPDAVISKESRRRSSAQNVNDIMEIIGNTPDQDKRKNTSNIVASISPFSQKQQIDGLFSSVSSSVKPSIIEKLENQDIDPNAKVMSWMENKTILENEVIDLEAESEVSVAFANQPEKLNLKANDVIRETAIGVVKVRSDGKPYVDVDYAKLRKIKQKGDLLRKERIPAEDLVDDISNLVEGSLDQNPQSTEESHEKMETEEISEVEHEALKGQMSMENPNKENCVTTTVKHVEEKNLTIKNPAEYVETSQTKTQSLVNTLEKCLMKEDISRNNSEIENSSKDQNVAIVVDSTQSSQENVKNVDEYSTVPEILESTKILSPGSNLRIKLNQDGHTVTQKTGFGEPIKIRPETDKDKHNGIPPLTNSVEADDMSLEDALYKLLEGDPNEETPPMVPPVVSTETPLSKLGDNPIPREHLQSISSTSMNSMETFPPSSNERFRVISHIGNLDSSEREDLNNLDYDYMGDGGLSPQEGVQLDEASKPHDNPHEECSEDGTLINAIQHNWTIEDGSPLIPQLRGIKDKLVEFTEDEDLLEDTFYSLLTDGQFSELLSTLVSFSGKSLSELSENYAKLGDELVSELLAVNIGGISQLNDALKEIHVENKDASLGVWVTKFKEKFDGFNCQTLDIDVAIQIMILNGFKAITDQDMNVK